MTSKEVADSFIAIKKGVGSANFSPEANETINKLLYLFEVVLGKLNKNSHNSSVPPSQDPNREKPKNKNSNNKVGGQVGHLGSTLTQSKEISKTIPISIDRRTLPKNCTFKIAEPEKRQVIDFEVNCTVTEYQAEVLVDNEGHRYVAEFPPNVTKAVQYGTCIKSNAVYMNYFQMCSIDRIADHFKDQLGINISTGSIGNYTKEAFEKLESFEDWAKRKLLESKVNHADETGINVGGKRIWLHTACNDLITIFQVHEKRGSEAMDDLGILPIYKGTLCHDHWKAYFKYTNCTHSLCNAHHIRELTNAEENENQNWAKKMREFLIKINEEVDKCGGVLTKKRQKKVSKEYRKILREAEKECPLPIKTKGKRGRAKSSFSRNLLERLKNFELETLAFMTSKLIPFTNNQGENDIRMTKVQQKISGCFRSMAGAKVFARIRSYINTCRKHNIGITEALKELFDGNVNTVLEKMENYAE